MVICLYRRVGLKSHFLLVACLYNKCWTKVQHSDSIPPTTTNLWGIPRVNTRRIQSPGEGRYMVARWWSRGSGGTPGKRTNK